MRCDTVADGLRADGLQLLMVQSLMDHKKPKALILLVSSCAQQLYTGTDGPQEAQGPDLAARQGGGLWWAAG